MELQAKRTDDPTELMLARELVSMFPGMMFKVEPMEYDNFCIAKVTVTTVEGGANKVGNKWLAMLLSTLGYNGALLVYPDDNMCPSSIIWVATSRLMSGRIFSCLNRAQIYSTLRDVPGDSSRRFVEIELPLYVKGEEKRAVQAFSDEWSREGQSRMDGGDDNSPRLSACNRQ